MTRRGLAAMIGLLATIAILGCGATPLSVSQLRGSATRICQLAAKQGDRVAAPSGPAATESFLRGGTRVMRFELAGLRSLRPPSSLSRQYATSLDAFAGQVRVLEGAVRSLNHGEDPLIEIRQLQQQLTPLESREDAAWRTIGVPACVNQ